MNNKRIKGLMCSILIFCAPFTTSVTAVEDNKSTIVINEIDSENDWVEIINIGSEEVDISGLYITDDKGNERLENDSDGNMQVIPLDQTTILKPGELFVFNKEEQFTFGLGKADTVILYNNQKGIIDQYSWQERSQGTYGRLPNGTGDFVDLMPTKALNNVEAYSEKTPASTSSLVINEINSAPDDWVELINISSDKLDISGYELRDDSDDHRWQFPDNTTISAGEIIVVESSTIGKVYNDQSNTYVEGEFTEALGIGSGDAIRLYNASIEKIDEYSWSNGHASYDGDAALASYGRYPDGTGAFTLVKESKGSTNQWYKPNVVINEVESNDDITDWVEIYNNSNEPIDISGWYVLDNDQVGHKLETTPIPDGTILEANGLYVFDQPKDFSFGLGKSDSVTIFSKGGAQVDTFTWTTPANGVYARVPDGVGTLLDVDFSSKGKLNLDTNKVVLSEVQVIENQGWIELANPTNELLDISGLIIKNAKSYEYIIPNGTTISELGYYVFNQQQLGFDMSLNDSISIYDGEHLIQTIAWEENIEPSLAIYPDLSGIEYRVTTSATPGEENKFVDIPEKIKWNGSKEVVASEMTFLSDASGLDYYQDKLYAVDNGEGRFWIVDVNPRSGELTFATGFENGKRVHFTKDGKDFNVAGPDSEGITVDSSGMVYLASERDNSNKGVNYNTILMVNPHVESENIVATKEWDLTPSLPQVSANMGLEAVEWVSNENVVGKLIDRNTNQLYDAQNYPNSLSGGVFFVALEDNGHVYAYVLNADGSSTLISDIDSKIGGAMALDYDDLEDVLWVKADNGYGNMSAMITLNGTLTPNVVHVLPPEGLDSNANNEGFAIATQSSNTVSQNNIDNTRTVYHFEDGIMAGSLKVGSINSDYIHSTGNSVEPPVINPIQPSRVESNLEKNPPATSATVDFWIYLMIMVLSGATIITIKNKKAYNR